MTTFVLPGDSVALESQTSLKLGPGIAAQSKDEGKIQAHASKAGLLGLQESRSKQGPVKGYWVEGHSRRVCHFGCRDDAILKVAGQYVPALGEYVVGVITARHAEGYRVDIGSSQYAALDALAFEGATKRSKPNLKIGAVVYGRVSQALSFAEPEMECVDQSTQKAHGMGELTGGMLLKHLELSRCRELLSPESALLSDLGTKFPFEIAVGVNGRVWIKAEELEDAIKLSSAITASS